MCVYNFLGADESNILMVDNDHIPQTKASQGLSPDHIFKPIKHQVDMIKADPRDFMDRSEYYKKKVLGPTVFFWQKHFQLHFYEILLTFPLYFRLFICFLNKGRTNMFCFSVNKLINIFFRVISQTHNSYPLYLSQQHLCYRSSIWKMFFLYVNTIHFIYLTMTPLRDMRE